MSAQGGVLHFDGRPADRCWVGTLSRALSEYGPDGEQTYFDGPLGMAYRPFHTTPESRNERQPVITSQGRALTWDGRLDNRNELANELALDPSIRTDAEIVAAAFERWETDSFTKLLGDWALVIWEPSNKTLVMARDIFAIRHLYYQLTSDRIIWSTDLRPMVLQPGVTWKLDEDFVAGFLVSIPEADRTPYVGLRAVPPATFVEVRDGRARARSYWHLEPREAIRYSTDAAYEEHFRHLFRNSVQSRLRSDAPVLSDLSGGMDSSSIVCMVDDIIARGETPCPRLNTITIYDEMEPTGDERIYARYVEAKRGRTGHHIHASEFADLSPVEPGVFVPRPGYFQSSVNLGRLYSDLMQRQGDRVLLRGVGGDEFLGGIPNPSPQLADLLITGQWREFAHRTVQWSVVKKRPFMNLLLKSLWQLFPRSLREAARLPDGLSEWVQPSMLRRCRLTSYCLWRNHSGRRLLLPTKVVNRHSHEHLSRQFAQTIEVGGYKESRYPFLDRRLVEFLAAIPDEQLQRPGQRRSLMRRALAGIVPVEVLSRKNKAGVSRGPTLQLRTLVDSLCGAKLSDRHLNFERLRRAALEIGHGDLKMLISVLKGLDLLIFCARWQDGQSHAPGTTFDWTASVQPIQKERR
jgi:asparagine synthase (glutamine-hydrolysing)